MQERGDGPLFVEAVLGGEIEHIDAAQLAIGRFANRPLDGGHAIGVGRLPQHIKKGFGLAHASRSNVLALNCARGAKTSSLRSLTRRAAVSANGARVTAN